MIEDEIINFRKYKIFKLNDEIYLYLCDFSGLYKIDENVVKVLENNGKNRKEIYYNLKNYLSEVEIEKILNDLKKLNIFNKEDINICKEESLIQSITLMLSQDCNMRCSYCFAGDGQYNNKGYMNIDIGKKAIDFIINNSKHKDISVCLFGGEPLLNFKLFKEIVEYCRNIEKTVNKNIFITTTTNGTLLTKEIEKFILDNKVSILVT